MRRRAPTLVGTGLLLCACVTTTSGLRVSGLPATTPRRSPRRAPEASVEAPISNDRRAVLLAGVVTLGAPLSLVAPARASPEFDAVRDELEGRGSGQLARIAALIDATDDAELVKLTREYNGYFRNTLLAAARKQLGEDDAAQGKALYNAVQVRFWGHAREEHCRVADAGGPHRDQQIGARERVRARAGVLRDAPRRHRQVLGARAEELARRAILEISCWYDPTCSPALWYLLSPMRRAPCIVYYIAPLSSVLLYEGDGVLNSDPKS